MQTMWVKAQASYCSKRSVAQFFSDRFAVSERGYPYKVISDANLWLWEQKLHAPQFKSVVCEGQPIKTSAIRSLISVFEPEDELRAA